MNEEEAHKAARLVRAHRLQCESKTTYYSIGAARYVKRQAQKTMHVKLSAYKCKHCGFFHVGRKKKHETIKRQIQSGG